MQKQNLEDNILVANYISGSEKSLEILVTRHKKRIFSFIYSKVLNRATAEDIFQDTFIKIINTLKAGRYNEEGKFISWAMRIAHNLVMDHFRKVNRKPMFKNTGDFDIFSVISDSSLNAENATIKNQIHSDVRQLVDKLPADQRDVLTMRIYKDMSFKEIAENTNTSINTSLGRMRYALINLRKIVAENKMILTN